MLFWISLILTIISGAVLIWLLIQHWREIRLLDPNTIRAEQERTARDRIVRDRFDRMLKRWSAPLRQAGRRMTRGLASTIRDVEQKLGVTTVTEDGTRMTRGSSGRIAEWMEEAATFAKEGKINRAERLYLEVLKVDMRHAGAYRGLGELYLADRQFPQAKETFQFLVSLGRADDAVYSGLATIAEAGGLFIEAEQDRKRAIELSPTSALRYGELADHYLKRMMGREALVAATKAVELDTGEFRYLELSARSAILLRDRVAAESFLRELRLNGYDRTKLETIKEMVDEMNE
ncbi:MAG: hypothetical protein WC477_03285 [Patescibacteria group bacterium]